MSGDVPQLVGSTYTASAYAGMPTATADNIFIPTTTDNTAVGHYSKAHLFQQAGARQNLHNVIKERPQAMAETKRRIAQVFIVDPDENVPLSDCMIYKGEQQITDLTDQELFFELDIKALLEKHNAKRVKIINKNVKERTEHLEPAKIRDLKMVVVSTVTF